MSMFSINWGTEKIEFAVKKRQRKSITIRVLPDKRIEVLVPLNISIEQVINRVRKKSPWILKQIDQFNAYNHKTPPRRFVNGETHLYLGRQYRLKIVPDNLDSVKAYRGQLWMHSLNPQPEALKKQLEIWYKQKANEIFTQLLHEVLPKFNRYKISTPALSIRTMSKRWGSCAPTGRITLNKELIKASKGSIEYVIIHELCHLVHRNHSKEFHYLLNRMLPDWRKRKEKLEQLLN